MYVLAVQVSRRDYTDNFFFIYDTASSSLRPVIFLNQLVVIETFFKATNFKKRKIIMIMYNFSLSSQGKKFGD